MIFIFFTLWMQQVYALSCDFEMSPEYGDVLPEYDLIFEGTMVERTTPEKTPPFNIWMLAGRYEFEIQKVWKGDARLKNIKVWGSATYDGYSAYGEGESYIVYVKYIRGYPVTSPGMCGPDHVYSETKMRELLREYELDMLAMKTNTVRVALSLNNNGKGTLKLFHPKEKWKGIAHPKEHNDSLSFVIKDDQGNRISPTVKNLKWSLRNTIELSRGEAFSTSVSVLKYLQGNKVYQYALEEGKNYRITAVYMPFGPSNAQFESNEVEIQYTK